MNAPLATPVHTKQMGKTLIIVLMACSRQHDSIGFA